MPNKFNKLVWIKKGNYLVVSISNEKIEENQPKGYIENVLYDTDIKKLKKEKQWFIIFLF
jgi:hypothetical protein